MILAVTFSLFVYALFIQIGGAQNASYEVVCTTLGTYIDCSNKQLLTVPSDLPDWVENLKLNRNALSEIPNLSNRNLTKLYLGHNRIQAILQAALDNITNLEVLEVNNNNISEITVDSFPPDLPIKLLNLNNNPISSIEDGSLNRLTSLRELRINRNKLVSINDTFKNLSTLGILELTRNQFTKIAGLTFKGSENLRCLILRQNSIEELADGAFFGLWNLVELELDYNKLTSVSKGWLYGLQSLINLTVSYNKIQFLNSGWDSCAHLMHLDLSNNKLQSIERLTFEHLTKLKVLKIDNNRISFIEDGAFNYTPSLEILDMSNNYISWIIENTSGTFFSLKNLKELHLSGNRIFHVGREAFLGLENVNYVNLYDNPIATMEENPFENLPRLKDLAMNTSSVICDCHIAWAPFWFNITGVLNKHDSIRCTYPGKIKRRILNYIPTRDLICDGRDYPQPRITHHPDNVVALVGHNVTLKCGANSTSSADMTFTWRRNNHRLENILTKRYESAQTFGITQFSELQLQNIGMTQGGSYQCNIFNDFGVSYSKSAQLTVLVFPTFVKTPVNVTARVGTTAKLECVATGVPPPRISWKKDGGMDFPAAQERRMKVMTPDDPFFIVNVKLMDVGVYTCMAKSAAGLIMANASITVLEPPSFGKKMSDVQVVVGDAAIFECMALGLPKPQISWTKDRKPIPWSKRHFLTGDDQLLVITDTVFSDSGLYECELTNTFGYSRDKSQLMVVPVYKPHLSNEDIVGIMVVTIVVSVVTTSAIWVTIIYLTKKKRCKRPGILSSPMDSSKCENSSNSSKDSGTGDSTKRSYQDLLLATATSASNHTPVTLEQRSESPSSNIECTLPLLSTFHPITADANYGKNNSDTSGKIITPRSATLKTPYRQSQTQHHIVQGSVFCAVQPTPAIPSACICYCGNHTERDVMECTCSPTSNMNYCLEHANATGTMYYKRPCSIPFHAAHNHTPVCCPRSKQNSFVCVYGAQNNLQP